MQLVTNGYDLFVARSIHESFSRKAGSHRVASAFSLCHLSRLIRVRRPKAVLEIGAGVGAASELILLHQEKVESLCSIEPDRFCRAALRENLLPRDGQSWHVLPSHEDIPSDGSFDLIVFDSGRYDSTILKFLRAETAVFIDGMRRRSRDELTRHCEDVGLSLRLHEYSGTWRVVTQGLGASRSAPVLALDRERCHLGVCKAMFPLSGIGWQEAALCAGVETA